MDSKKIIVLNSKNTRDDYLRILNGESVGKIAREYKNPSRFVRFASRLHTTAEGKRIIANKKISDWLSIPANFEYLANNYAKADLDALAARIGVDKKSISYRLKERLGDEFTALRNERMKQKAKLRYQKSKTIKPKNQTHWALTAQWTTTQTT